MQRNKIVALKSRCADALTTMRHSCAGWMQTVYPHNWHTPLRTSTCILVVLFLFAGCSTKKNTAGTRFYHAMTTRYNVYFNGNEAFKSGSKAIEQGNKDNYMEILPLYPIGNKSTVGTGKSDFDRAIEKSQKAVTVHSIKRKPARKQGKKYSDKYKQWLKRREFNPFLHKAWMLMGKAQFQKGDFPEAAATFSYIARLYAGQPEITTNARIWLARCYTQLEWYYDAEDVLQKVNNDSLPQALAPAYATTFGNYLLGSERYREAVPHLLTTIKNEKNKRQKAREYYLLGQVYQLLEEPQNAYQAFGKVISLSPPYELELNARIRQTETTLGGGKHNNPAELKKVTEKLRRMAHSEKNKDYLDQIYYALGNVYLANQDTLQAIKEYKTGVEKSTRGGVEKGILQLTLGNLCWQLGKYADAQTAYADAIGLLEKTHDQYKEVTRRSEVLDELLPFATAVELQDSLQHLASLDSAARMVVIDTLIARVIQREEAEKAAAKEAEREQLRAEIESDNAANQAQRPDNQKPAPTAPTGDKSWYFYNSQVVTQGKADFQRLWGRRKSEDNWRRKNKTVVALDEFEAVNYDEEGTNPADSLSGGSKIQPQIGEDGQPLPEQTAEADTTAIDEKNPLFYLQQIPLTEEAMTASNEILSDGLFNMGMILKDKLEDFPRAEGSFERLLVHFPDFKQLDEAYYNYYLMLGRMGRTVDADRYKHQLIERFPESKFALTLADPDFAYNAIYGKHLEDSLYARTYKEYQAGNFSQVAANSDLSGKKYPMGQHRPKFMFLHSVCALQAGDQKQFLAELKELVQQYPEHEITDLAAHILKGVQEGRLLAKGAASFGNIWARRSGDLLSDSTRTAGQDSIPAFSTERNTPYLFILAYEEGKVNENQLLYEVARYNFSSFMVKSFDLNFTHDRGIGRLAISTFANMDEALYYQRQLYADPHMNERLSGMRSILISEANYELLNQYYSFDDYDAFYTENFPATDPSANDEETAPNGSTLDEPMQNLPPVDETAPEDEEEGEEEIDEGGGYIVY